MSDRLARLKAAVVMAFIVAAVCFAMVQVQRAAHAITATTSQAMGK